MAKNLTPVPSFTPLKAFTGRKGTVDEGKNFEELMIISKCLELTFNKNVSEFKISSDDADFGDFDDLVIEANYIDGIVEKVALQLKHVANDSKSLKNEMLGGTGKQFSISKYFRSDHKIPDDFSLILYTNRNYKMENEKQTMDCRIGEADIRVDVLKTSEKNRYEFSVNEEETVSKENTEKSVSKDDIEKYGKFLKRFELKSNQENTKQLENRLVGEFHRIHGTEDTFLRFKDFIIRWKKRQEYKLNKKYVTIKIVESLLSPYIKTISHDLYSADFGSILRKAILSFRLTTFEETNDIIHRIWPKATSNGEIDGCGLEYFLLTDTLDNIKDETLKRHKYTLISWHLRQCPLIVEVTGNSKLAINKAVDLLKKNRIENRKLLLLGQKEQMQWSGCFRDLNCLKNVNQTVYQEILEKFSCSIQGRFHKLQEIVDSEPFEKLITTDFLVEMSTSNFNVGRKPEEPPEFYVSRALPRILVDFKFLKDDKTDDLILINCNGKKERVKKMMKELRTNKLEELLGNDDDRGLIQTSDDSKKIIFLHSVECSPEDYTKLLQNFPSKNCHQFNFCEESMDLEWVNTSGDVKMLRSYKAKDKIFEKEDEFLQTSRRNIKIVCADPGMGKTTMLNHFCKSKTRSCWLLHIIAGQCASKIKENTYAKKVVLSLASDAVARKFIETFYDERKIIFMWDGMDEILDPEQRHVVYGFIKNIQQLGFIQFITARCNIQRELEEKFNTFATRIEELTKCEQDEFLNNRLCKKYSAEHLSGIRSKITENMEYLETDKILGVPLQLYLLTELFLQTSNIDDVTRKLLTATTLLAHFVNNKFETYFKKIGNENTYNQRTVKETFIKRYKLLGTKTCLESIIADSNFFHQSEISELSSIQKDDDPIGLVKKSDGVPLFIHHSYAEYFAALFLSENPRRITNFQKVYFDDRCRNLRFMLDLILARDCPAHTAVLYRNLAILEDNKEGILKEDPAGRNAFHVALSWAKEHLPLPDIIYSDEIRNEDFLDKFKMIGPVLKYITKNDRKLIPVLDKMLKADYRRYSNNSLLELAVVTNDINAVKCIGQNDGSSHWIKKVGLSLVYAAFIGNEDICKFLIETGARVNCRAANSGTPCIYAAARGYSGVAKILIDNKAKVNMTDNAKQSPLFFAVMNNRSSVVKLLIKNKADVNLANQNGTTPLIVAARYGHLHVTKILIDNNALVNMAERGGHTPLFYAATNDKLSVLRLLIENNGEVNMSNGKGRTPLMMAAQDGYLDIATILIHNKAEVNMRDGTGRSPLFFAAMNNQLSVVELLIKNNADVNLPNKKGRTPLIMAAQDGYLDISKILIDHKAEVNMTDATGRSPLFFAVWNNQLPVIELLIENNAEVNIPNINGVTPLGMAAEDGYLKIAKILIENAAEVNITDGEARSALFFAAWKNQLPVTQLLIENNAKVDLPNRNGVTPLMKAAETGHLKMVNILIYNKAEINAKEREGRSVLYLAVWNNQLEVVQWLIENNAELDFPNNDGVTPLMMAAMKGHFAIAKILIVNKAKVNVTECEGRSPLFFAAANNQLPVVQLLIENNAKVNPSDKCKSPLSSVSKRGHLDVARLLIDNNAEINMKDSEGWTPLFFAVKKNKLEMVQLLIHNKAQINCRLENGTSPLMIACDEGYFEIANFLLENKTTMINWKNWDGDTALQLAERKNHLDIVKLLIENGAEGNTIVELDNLPLELPVYFHSMSIENSKKPRSFLQWLSGWFNCRRQDYNI